jgi:TRAP-type mannitol/chloroaromatic compound transport system, small permease component
MFMKLYTAYGRFLGVVGALAGIATFALMWLVDVNVITRRGLNAPVPGSVEISQALLVVTVTLGLAYAQSRGAHLRVTIFAGRQQQSLQRWLYVAAMIIGFAFFTVLTYAMYKFAQRAFNVNEYAWGAGIRFPLYPVKALACAGTFLLALQFLLDALRVGVFNVTYAHDSIIQPADTEAGHV